MDLGNAIATAAAGGGLAYLAQVAPIESEAIKVILSLGASGVTIWVLWSLLAKEKEEKRTLQESLKGAYEQTLAKNAEALDKVAGSVDRNTTALESLQRGLDLDKRLEDIARKKDAA